MAKKKEKKAGKQINPPEEKILNQRDDKGTLKIATFLKEQPTAIFTVIAGAVTILSFFSNVSIFLYDKAYLFMWDVEEIYIAISTPSKFYRVCSIALFMVCALFLYVVFRDNILGKYRANWRKARISIYTFLISMAFILMTDGIPVEFVAYISVSTLLLALLAVCLRFALLLRINVRYKRVRESEERSDTSENKGETDKDRREQTDVDNSSRFNDKAIGHFFKRLIVCSLLVLAFYSCLGIWSANLKKSFPVVYIDDRSYASVYNTGEKMILEECDVTDGIITQIHKEKQKIVSIEGIEYEIMDYVPESETEPTQPSETESTIEETT